MLLPCWSVTDEAKKPRKQRRYTKQLHADLWALGYTGSYDKVTAFARSWRQEEMERIKGVSKRTYIPLRFAPGEAFQFDWSEDWAIITSIGLVLPLFLYVSMTGFIVANAIAGALGLSPSHLEALSPLIGSIQYDSFGILGSAQVGILANGMPIPMACIIALCGTGCAAFTLIL